MDTETSPGMSAAYTLTGRDGDTWIRLQAGEATPGLSGAPTLTGPDGVVGLISVTKHPDEPRGGWVSPADELRRLEPCPDGTTSADDIWATNGRDCWRHREAWAQAVIPGDNPLERPWTLEFDPNEDSPSAALLPEFRVVPLVGRADVLAELEDWCRQPASFSIRTIQNLGGTGKTRLAVELSAWLEQRGWTTGFLTRATATVPTRGPRLVVVDYASEHAPKARDEALQTLSASATPLGPVRVLLLDRKDSHAATLVASLKTGEASAALKQSFDRAQTMAGATVDLTHEDRTTLYAEAYTRFRGEAPDAMATPDLSKDGYERPLDVIVAAYDKAVVTQSDSTDPFERVLDHEMTHWRARSAGKSDMSEASLLHVMALVTLCGARSLDETTVLLDVAGAGERSLNEVDRLARGMYPGSWQWNPLRPDRLGEALISRWLEADPHRAAVALHRLVETGSLAQVSRLFAVGAKVTRGELAFVTLLATATRPLLRHLTLLSAPLEEDQVPINRGTAMGSAGTGELEAALGQLVLRVPDASVLGDSTSALANGVGVLLDRLALLLPEAGLPAARAAALLVRALCERALDVDPGNRGHQRDLSVSYERLADLARTEGDPDTARRFYTDSLTIRKVLADRELGNTSYQRDLSISYNKLADLALTEGDPRHRPPLLHRQPHHRPGPGSPGTREHQLPTRPVNQLQQAGRPRPHRRRPRHRPPLLHRQPHHRPGPGSPGTREHQLPTRPVNQLQQAGRPRPHRRRPRHRPPLLHRQPHHRPGPGRPGTREHQLPTRPVNQLRPSGRPRPHRRRPRHRPPLLHRQPHHPQGPGRPGTREHQLPTRPVNQLQQAGRPRPHRRRPRHRPPLLHRQPHHRPGPGSPGTREHQLPTRPVNQLQQAGRPRPHRRRPRHRPPLLHRQPHHRPGPGSPGTREHQLPTRPVNQLQQAGRPRPHRRRPRHRPPLLHRQPHHRPGPGRPGTREHQLPTRPVNQLRPSGRPRPHRRRPDTARRFYTDSLTIRKVLADRELGNTSYQRDLSISYDRLADLALTEGDPDTARRFYTDSLTIAQALADREPGNTSYQRDLSISYNKLADLARTEGDPDTARRFYTDSLTIAQALADREPGNTSYQRDLSISYDRLADLALTEGDPDTARRFYTDSLTIAQALAAREPGNTSYQRDLSISYNKLADLALTEGDPDTARRFYTDSLTIAQALADREPGNTSYQRDLSVSYERLADLALRENDPRAAVHVEQALRARLLLAAREPTREDLAVELGYALYLASFVGITFGEEGRTPREVAAHVLTPFEQAGRLGPRGRALLAWAREA
ncbi:MAG: hypothetical protein IPH03_18630 [Tetrasphaera sp.]|nr:hypothetical protein [Tetrasphaera sp.]